MGWFLPSYGRPSRLREMLDAPGGWPRVHLMVNTDDPARDLYFETRGDWPISILPAGSRCADAHRFITKLAPTSPFYGLLCDDQWPVTPGWWQAMEKAAEDRYVVTPAGEPSFPLIRTAVCIGGGLVRAMGSLVPALVKHNFEDNIWDDVAREHSLLRTLPAYVVEHRHHIRGQASVDETYLRGSADFETDQKIYETWLESDDKKRMNERIAKFLSS